MANPFGTRSPRRAPAVAPFVPSPPIGTMSGLAGAQSGHSAPNVSYTRIYRMVATSRGGLERGMKTALEKDYTGNQARPRRFGSWKVPDADL